MARIVKQIDGDMSKVIEVDGVDGDRGPAEAESVRLGDARVMPNRSKFLPNQSKTFAMVGQSAVAVDPFLHDKLPGGLVRPQPVYAESEPEVNDRPDGLNFPESEESGIADASGFRPAKPGDIGGRPASSYVVKRGEEILKKKSGIFASILNDPSNASGYGEQK